MRQVDLFREVHASPQGERELEAGVLRILAARGVRVEDESRRRILGCTDLTTLDRWFERALRANSLSEVLDDPTR